MGRRITPRRLAGTLLLAAALACAWAWWPRAAPEPAPEPPADDPRLTFATPYRNVRPEVKYVGDAACATCHEDLCDSYHKHPMGRSAAVSPCPADRLPPNGLTAFDALGLRYTVERRGDRLYHRAASEDRAAAAATAKEVEAQLAIGSGTRGTSYVYADDGFAFQSPVSWYGVAKRWDVSPGYRERNDHFDRPVTAACLFCHVDRAEPVTDTVNRFRAPLVSQAAVGCERCHGPGELHARRYRDGEAPGDGRDDTIVNPKHLEPALREAVCEQCHLQGQARVLRRGRAAFDYRPGLPLHLFWAVFVDAAGSAGHKAVGQVEQTHLSRCFRASGGRLGCASCHDPHAKPSEGEKGAYYRARCLTCHREGQCSEPMPSRRAKADNCVTCHMPRLEITDIAHIATTDHRIPRRPGAAPPGEPPAWGRPPLVPFHPELRSERELGMALADLLTRTPPGPSRAGLAQMARPLLLTATREAPDDLAAWEGLGFTWRTLGRPGEALEAYEAALRAAPRREQALAGAAMAAEELRRPSDAAGYWQRALDVSPRRPLYHQHLGLTLAEQGRLPEALAACAEAVRLSPTSVEARLTQVSCLLSAGEKEKASTAFAVVLALKPPRVEELRRWFEHASQR